jgi:PAS domain S-box-containing protein
MDISEFTNNELDRGQDSLLYELLDSLSSGIFLVNSNLRMTYLNHYAQEFFSSLANWDFEPEDLLDKPMFETLKKHVVESFKSQRVDRAEFSFTDKEGKLFWLGVTLTCPQVKDGSAPVVLGVFKDITGIKAFEQKRGWETGMRSISLLASGIAHEFNNLFSSLSAYYDLYKQDKSFEDKLLQAVEEGIERGVGIVNRLHNFAFHPGDVGEPCDPIITAVGVVGLLQAECSRRGIVCQTSFRSSSKISIPADTLKKIVFDLLTNAVHAVGESGSVDILLYDADENFINLEISDSGPGLDKEQMETLFTPFYTTKGALGLGSDEGKGLGLYFIYTMLQGYGGEISVESSPGVGARFKLKLPVAK